mgnify:CR=1 FL=1
MRTIRVDEATYTKLYEEAVSRGTSIGAVVRHLVTANSDVEKFAERLLEPARARYRATCPVATILFLCNMDKPHDAIYEITESGAVRFECDVCDSRGLLVKSPDVAEAFSKALAKHGKVAR